MFIDSDDIIKKNKDKIIYEKYSLLSQNLINQRKMFFDSLLNTNKIKLEIDTGYKPIKIKYKSLAILIKGKKEESCMPSS